MRAEQLQLALRPRPMFEAVDLGVRMTQTAAASLRRAYLPLALLLVVACGSTIEVASWLPSTLLWWLKPWLDRTLLDIYARQVFGQSTGFAQAWQARQSAPWLPLLKLLTLSRFSQWRSYTMPVTQLEGQTGAPLRQRLQVFLRNHRSAAFLAQSAFAWAEFFLVLACLSMLEWLSPGLRFPGILADLGGNGTLAVFLLYAAHAVAVLFIEPFYVASGFAMYLNRRVELEAWDVEQDLRHAFAQS